MGAAMARMTKVQGFSLDLDLLRELREVASATEIPASRLVNSAVAAFLKERKAGVTQ
jgi:predicted transcriptional regulator